LGLKEEQEEGFNWDAENNIRTNFGNRWGIVCLLFGFSEVIWS
jgi:hypothetical protein